LWLSIIFQNFARLQCHQCWLSENLWLPKKY